MDATSLPAPGAGGAHAVLIGDVVGSRRAADRHGLQRSLERVLERVEEVVGGRLEMTFGDEFQGRFEHMDAAIEASFRLHLETWAATPIRLGLGWGPLLVEGPEETLRGQDGPAWWRARDAIEALEGPARAVRTVIVTGTAWDQLLNGFLATRDTVMGAMDDVDAGICLGLLDGQTQRSLAARFDLHESSVSRRVGRHGLATLVANARPSVPLGSIEEA